MTRVTKANAKGRMKDGNTLIAFVTTAKYVGILTIKLIKDWIVLITNVTKAETVSIKDVIISIIESSPYFYTYQCQRKTNNQRKNNHIPYIIMRVINICKISSNKIRCRLEICNI